MDTIYEDATWGKHGKDIIPNPIYRVYRVQGTWAGDDESLLYSFEPGEDIQPSEISIVGEESDEYGNIGFNKFGLTGDKEVVTVTITPSEGLAEAYVDAIVNVDGEYHDLAWLNTAHEFYMDKNHRISIEWAPNLRETFRIIKLA